MKRILSLLALVAITFSTSAQTTKKTTELPQATALTTSDEVLINQAGVTKRGLINYLPFLKKQDSTKFVPVGRTLTINGTSYDLSQNRSWTIAGGGSVTKHYIDLADYAGFDPTFTTDQTAVFQSAINDANSMGAATILVPNGHYKIAGALKTTDGLGHSVNSCQIYFPYHGFNDSAVKIKIRGESPPNFAGSEYFVGAGPSRPSTGVVIESTILGNGSLFGNAYANPSYSGFQYGDFSFAYSEYENLTIRVRSTTGATHVSNQMTGINGRNIISQTVRTVRVETQSRPNEAATPGAGTAGIIWPGTNNRATCMADLVCVQGFESGIIVGEHFMGNNIFSVINTYAVGTESTTDLRHPARINKLVSEGCAHFFRIKGAMNLLVDQASFEKTANPGKYFDFTSDVVVVSGATGVVEIRHNDAAKDGLPNYEFAATSFKNVRLSVNYNISIDENVQTLTAGSTMTLNPLYGKKAYTVLNTNAAISVMPNPDIRNEFTLVAKQDATGGRTVTFPSGVYISGTPLTAAGSVNVYNLKYIGSFWSITVNPMASVVVTGPGTPLTWAYKVNVTEADGGLLKSGGGNFNFSDNAGRSTQTFADGDDLVFREGTGSTSLYQLIVGFTTSVSPGSPGTQIAFGLYISTTGDVQAVENNNNTVTTIGTTFANAWYRIRFISGTIVYQQSSDAATWTTMATSVYTPTGSYYAYFCGNNPGASVTHVAKD